MNAQTKVEAATLSSAMALAFAEIEGAKKDANNPHFNAKFASLGSVMDAVKPALSNHGLFFTQASHVVPDGVCVETIIHHASGETLSCGQLYVPANKKDAQGFGSALTYARRYSLMTAFGVPTEDDDGNAAVSSASTQSRSVPKAVPASDEQRDLIQQIAPGAGKTLQGICESYKITSLKELTFAQADSLIARLRSLTTPAKEPVNA